MDSITIRKPDDWHAHLRDGSMLRAVLPFHIKRFGRAIVMPNLAPDPVTVKYQAEEYQERIEDLTGGSTFKPLMTFYMTEQTDPKDIMSSYLENSFTAIKLYPANATTNSARGVTDIHHVYPVIEVMQKLGIPLLLHGETVSKDGSDIPAADREKVFLDSTLPTLLKDFPNLKVVLEHATTKNAIDYIRNEKSNRLASTITVHHLMTNSEDVTHDDHPGYLQCMPVIKSPEDQKALREAATSGEPYFFLGTDSAPHPVSAKEKVPPASGVFTAPAAVELYAQVFDEMQRMENFEKFASLNGPAFYGLTPNEETLTLVRKPWTIDSLVSVENGDFIRPFGYDENPEKRLHLTWSIA